MRRQGHRDVGREGEGSIPSRLELRYQTRLGASRSFLHAHLYTPKTSQRAPRPCESSVQDKVCGVNTHRRGMQQQRLDQSVCWRPVHARLQCRQSFFEIFNAKFVDLLRKRFLPLLFFSVCESNTV